MKFNQYIYLFRRYILYYILTLLFLYLYSINIKIGVFNNFSLLQNAPLEYITILILYTIFFITLKGKKLIFIPFLFLFSYVFIDYISEIYNRYIDYSDILNIPMLFRAILHSKGEIVYLLFLIPTILLYFLIKNRTIRLYFTSILIIMLLFTIPLPKRPLLSKIYLNIAKKYIYKQSYFWTPNLVDINYAKTGRLSSFFYEGMIKNLNLTKIYKYIYDVDKELYIKSSHLKDKIEHRNVYLIGLESFFLPQDLKKLKMKYLNNDKNRSYDIVKYSSLKITSIYGGGTIQSEFEALCGVPAMQKISAFEFTEFTGKPTNCLPRILSSLDFTSIVTNSYKPQPSFIALKSVGFQEINFPKEYFPNKRSYLNNKNKLEGEYAIFDTDLFEQNYAYIKNKFIDKNKTVFNYIFSVWGHAFHEMNPKIRPMAIKILNAKELGASMDTIRAVNQSYYRIKALQKYFDKLKKNDPNALVIAFSDHRAVLDGANSWKKYGYDKSLFLNYIIIMDKSKYIKLKKPLPLYALPDLILDLLTNHYYCKHYGCKIYSNPKERQKYIEEYYKIMANGMFNYK